MIPPEPGPPTFDLVVVVYLRALMRLIRALVAVQNRVLDQLERREVRRIGIPDVYEDPRKSAT